MPNFVEAISQTHSYTTNVVTFNLNADTSIASTITLSESVKDIITTADSTTRGDQATIKTSESQQWKFADAALIIGTEEPNSSFSATISTGSPFIYLTQLMLTSL